MTITMERAVAMFHYAKEISYQEVKLNQLSLIYARLYNYAKEWENLDAEIRKDVEEARKPIVEKFMKLSEDEKKEKEPEFNQKIMEAINNLTSVKAQPEFLKKEIEVDLPTFTEDEWCTLSHAKVFKNIAEAGIFYDLVAK